MPRILFQTDGLHQVRRRTRTQEIQRRSFNKQQRVSRDGELSKYFGEKMVIEKRKKTPLQILQQIT